MRNKRDRLKKRDKEKISQSKKTLITSNQLVARQVMFIIIMKTIELTKQQLRKVNPMPLHTNLEINNTKNKKLSDKRWLNKLHRDKLCKPKLLKKI
jgi:hypothetical protein